MFMPPTPRADNRTFSEVVQDQQAEHDIAAREARYARRDVAAWIVGALLVVGIAVWAYSIHDNMQHGKPPWMDQQPGVSGKR
ncbi:MAG: hypothetical protein ABSD03_01010 [Vulcanimicrobiaceae bacterium]|jgi:hypothetical protein